MTDDPTKAAASRTPTVMWTNGKFVCVEIIDAPLCPSRDGVCHCEACDTASRPDLAARFLP